MKVYLSEGILYIKAEDVPPYKKGGSVVRNSYFWALKSIACLAPREKDWEFDAVVWVALARLLMTFAQSGYLGLSETILEFPYEEPIPDLLRSVSTQGSTPGKSKN
jgi:hypothetical protein